MTTQVSVGNRVSTRAYIFMGIALMISGIILISIHYGIASTNPRGASIVWSVTLSLITAFPVWGGAIAMVVGLCFIIVGAAFKNNIAAIKGVSVGAIFGGLIQIIAFGFACNGMSRTVQYIRIATGLTAVYNYLPIVYSVVYMVIFLANAGMCIGSLILGRKLIMAHGTRVAQSNGQTNEAAGYVNPSTNTKTENF